MTTKIDVEKSNTTLQFAVENNNCVILEWVINIGQPTNINECILLAIEKNLPSMVNLLLKHTKTRPLVVLPKVDADMSKFTTKVGGNSQFMVTLVTDPKQALLELESGVISLAEANHQNDAGWSPLMYLARNAYMIPEAETIVRKLFEMKIDLNLRQCNGKTALILATSNHNAVANANMVELLFNQPGIDITACDERHQDFIYGLVFHCPETGRVKVEELLERLRGKMNFNTYDKKRRHAVIRLASRGKMMAVEMLLKTDKIEVDLNQSICEIAKLENDKRTELLGLLKKYNALKI